MLRHLEFPYSAWQQIKNEFINYEMCFVSTALLNKIKIGRAALVLVSVFLFLDFVVGLPYWFCFVLYFLGVYELRESLLRGFCSGVLS